MLRSTTTWTDQEPRRFSIPLPDEFSCLRRFKFSRNYVVAAAGSNILVYSLPNGSLIHSLQVHEEGSRAFDVYQDTLVTTSADNTLRIWDLVSGECFDSYTLDESRDTGYVLIVKPTMVEFEQGGTFFKKRWPKELVILWADDPYRCLSIWKVPHPRKRTSQSSAGGPSTNRSDKQSLQGHDGRIQSLVARGRTAITGSQDCTARVWDIVTRDCNWVLTGHTSAVSSIRIDHRQAYTGSVDATVRVWDLQTGECLHILKPPLFSSTVLQIRISPSYLVSSYFGGMLCIWDLTSGKLNHQLPSIGHWTTSFRHDERKILYGSLQSLKLRDIHSGKLLKDLLLDHYIEDVAFRGRFCIAHARRDGRDWLEVWRFNDADGFVEEVSDGEDLDS